MQNLARRIVEAIQHTTMDQLLVRLLGLFWPCWFLAQAENLAFLRPPLWVFIAVVLLAFAGGWMLGAVARTAVRRGAGPLERLHDPPANGFDVWKVPPAGGVRPPPAIRSAVAWLGSRSESSGWARFAEAAAQAAALLILLGGAYPGPAARLGQWITGLVTHEGVHRLPPVSRREPDPFVGD